MEPEQQILQRAPRVLVLSLCCGLILFGLCGAAGSTAIAKKNNPVEDGDGAWGPRHQLKLIRNQKRDARRSQSLIRRESKLVDLEREIRELETLQRDHLRAITRLRQQIQALKAQR